MREWGHQFRFVVRAVPIMVVAAALQTTLFTDVRVAGVSPELLVVMAALAGLYGGPEAGASIGFIGGLLYDSALSSPFGLTALVYCCLGYIIGSVQSTLHEPGWWLSSGVAALGAGLGTATVALGGEVIGQDLVDGRFIRIVVVAAACGLVIGPLVAPLMRWVVEPAVADIRQRDRLAS